MLLYNKTIFKRCFHYRKKYWYKNLKYIPLYFRLLNDLMKYGYDEYATWETANWFIDTMKSVLTRYRDGHCGDPIIIDNYFEYEDTEEASAKNAEEWNKIVNRMIELLDLMDESNPKYDTKEYENLEGMLRQDKEMNTAKEEFFSLFSKYFYYLWD